MIHNVFGKAVTKSTLLRLPEYHGKSEISCQDLARVALALKNSQGKDKDEENGLRYVERLRDQCELEDYQSTLGWLYNASGGAITLVDSRKWGGGLASSSLYPVRIENGQWGVFLHRQSSSEYESESSGAVLYEGFSPFGSTCFWCIAWKNQSTSSSAQVHVWIEREADWKEYAWKDVNKALENFDSLHRAKQEGWRSVVSASSGPHVVFEALLTMQNL